MRKKLLDKTLRVYLVFSVAILVISAPLFYLVTDRIFIQDADETLALHKKEFLQYQADKLNQAEIVTWNRFNRDIKILDTVFAKKDSLFYRSFLDTLDNEVEPYRVLYSPVRVKGRPYTLMVRISLVESEDIVKSVALLFLAILTVLLIGLYFITKRLSINLWSPFYSTLNKIEHFDLPSGELPAFEGTGIEEFTRLNQSVSKLLERDTLAYKNQKEFIENAAHELQTPLATFQAKLDVLVQKLAFTQEVGDTLSDLNDAVARLNRINKNLLLLSKIDNNHFISMDLVSVESIVMKQTEFLREQVVEKNIEVYQENVDSLSIRANSTLLEIVVSNLLLNACRHNREGGQINIQLRENALIISNTSTSHALDKSRLFQRFSYSGSDGGNGLGLAIVAKIGKLHGWRLDYQFSNELHVFTIFFTK